VQRQGLYRPSTKTPYTPGYEGSGVVEKFSDNINDLKENDRVIVFGSSGMWKEVVLVPRSNVFKIPDNMTYEDAAGLLVNYITAYQMLFRMANLKEGDSILIQMAAGGVGTAAIQLCRTIPNVTIFGTASLSKHDVLRLILLIYILVIIHL
jgi:synaptic vesicle membrane protein VAT-1